LELTIESYALRRKLS